MGDLRAALIAETLRDLAQLLLDHRQHPRLVAEDRAQLGDPLGDVGVLLPDGVRLKSRQLRETQIEDGRRLDRAELEVRNELFARSIAVAQHLEPGRLRSRNSGKPYHQLEGPRQRSNHVFVHSRDQLRVHIIRVQLQHALGIVSGLCRQPEPCAIGPLHHRHIGASQAAHPGARKKRIHIVGILAQPPIRLVHGLIGKRKNLVALLFVLLDGVASGQETVIRIERRVQQVLVVELLKHQCVHQVRRGLRVARMRGVIALEDLNRPGVIQIVEILESRSNLRVVIHRVGIHARRPCRAGHGQP